MAKKPDEIDPRKLAGVGREYMKEAIKAKMRLFGCSGKAEICRVAGVNQEKDDTVAWLKSRE